MRPVLTVLLLLSTLLLPLSGGAVPSVDASAVGTTSFTVHDGYGVTLCDSSALFALETTGPLGALAWDVPECEGPWATGVVPLTFWCTDACFNDCVLDAQQVRCWPRGGTLLGDWAWTYLTLDRDGTFRFEWWAWDASSVAVAEGTLLVTTWPAS